MTTLVASPSGQLVQPGAPLVEPDELPGVRAERDAATPPDATVHERDLGPRYGDVRTRESRWACEWWPPES